MLEKQQRNENSKRSYSNDSTLWDERQRSVVEANRHMFDNHVACDVIFLLPYNFCCDDNQPADDPWQFQSKNLEDYSNIDVQKQLKKVEAHRYVLSSRSPVFYAMFCGPLTNDKLQSQDIIIPDMCAESFTQVLRFLYYEEATITDDNVFSVLYGAKKYLIEPLADLCRSYLKQSLTVDDVCTILNQCLAFSELTLVQQCLRFIRSNTYQVVKSLSFNCISLEALQLIVKLEELNIEEVDLFIACRRWGTEELKRRNITTEGDPCLSMEQTKSGSSFLSSLSSSMQSLSENSVNSLSSNLVATVSDEKPQLEFSWKRGSLKVFADKKIKKKHTDSRYRKISPENNTASIERKEISAECSKTMDNHESTLQRLLTGDAKSNESSLSTNLRQVLNTVLPFIHFDSMSLQDIEQAVIPAHVLDKKELEEIIKKIIAPHNTYGYQVPNKRNKLWQEPCLDSSKGFRDGYSRQSNDMIKGKTGVRWDEESERIRSKSVENSRRPMIKSGFSWSIPFQLFW